MAAIYNELLLEIDEIVIPPELAGNYHVYYLYVVRAKDRDGLRRHLNESGIDTGVYDMDNVVTTDSPAYVLSDYMTGLDDNNYTKFYNTVGITYGFATDGTVTQENVP